MGPHKPLPSLEMHVSKAQPFSSSSPPTNNQMVPSTLSPYPAGMKGNHVAEFSSLAMELLSKSHSGSSARVLSVFTERKKHRDLLLAVSKYCFPKPSGQAYTTRSSSQGLGEITSVCRIYEKERQCLSLPNSGILECEEHFLPTDVLMPGLGTYSNFPLHHAGPAPPVSCRSFLPVHCHICPPSLDPSKIPEGKAMCSLRQVQCLEQLGLSFRD